MDGDKSFGTIDEEIRGFELTLVPPPVPSTNSYPRVEPSIPFTEQPPPLVDWDSIAIHEEREDEGRIELCDEAQVYALLGFIHDDEMEQEINMQNDVPNPSVDGESGYGIPSVEGAEDALMPVVDNIPEMSMIEHDMNNPSMEVGTRYPNMKDFRLTVRQYAINKEFELGIEATNKSKYRGYCKGDGCPWSIVGFKKEGEVSVVVTVLNDVHTCTSSSRRRTTTPSCKWVASKAVSILRKYSHMGTKELQVRLQDEHKCTIGYDTVWKGKEKALDELYGSWEESFQLLYNWRAEVMKRMPDSVIEIECRVVKGPLNGTKKRPRKPTKNSTKEWFPKESTPERSQTTREQLMQESPGIMTRRCLGILMEEGMSQEASTQALETTAIAPRKMTPRKAKRKL